MKQIAIDLDWPDAAEKVGNAGHEPTWPATNNLPAEVVTPEHHTSHLQLSLIEDSGYIVVRSHGAALMLSTRVTAHFILLVRLKLI